MYFGDHVPPHFHAYYGEYSAQVRIDDFGVETGYLPPKAIGLVVEWASLHKPKLLVNWNNLIENGSGVSEKIELRK